MDQSTTPSIYRMFRIGFDCHRTFLDTNTALRRYVYNKFRVTIPPNRAIRHEIVRDYLDHDEYESVLNAIITNIGYVVRHVKEVPGAKMEITRLQAEGHFVEMASSSSYDAHIATIKLLKHMGICIPTRAIGRQKSKSIIARDYDVFFEDRIDQAEALYLGGTPFVYLLTTPTNEQLQTPDSITRVPNWNAFGDEVRQLAHRLYPQSL